MADNQQAATDFCLVTLNNASDFQPNGLYLTVR